MTRTATAALAASLAMAAACTPSGETHVVDLAPDPGPGLPALTASCPAGTEVRTDDTGSVWIGGQPAQVRAYSATYFEATRDGTTASFTVAHDRSVAVSYTGPSGATGPCRVS